MDEKSERIALKILSTIDFIIDLAMICAILLIIAYAAYGYWDSKNITEAALPVQYEEYKPRDDFSSFNELVKANPDVIGWITLYGTNIDYPVLHSDDDWTYVNADARGNYSLTGSIFLASANRRDFRDFNSIIYGHNMTPQVMFGGIKEFKDREYFKKHRYGDLYHHGRHYGLEIAGIFKADAYDGYVYNPGIKDVYERGLYLNNLYDRCSNKRKLEISTDDNIVLLSTCSNENTNERDVLLGVIRDETFDDPFADVTERDHRSSIIVIALMCVTGAVILMILIILIKRHKRQKD